MFQSISTLCHMIVHKQRMIRDSDISEYFYIISYDCPQMIRDSDASEHFNLFAAL